MCSLAICKNLTYCNINNDVIVYVMIEYRIFVAAYPVEHLYVHQNFSAKRIIINMVPLKHKFMDSHECSRLNIQGPALV